MSMHRAPARDPQRSDPGRLVGRHAGREHPDDAFDYDPDWDVEDDEWLDEDVQPRVLWGRVVILGGALLLAFLAGRLTAGDDSAAELAATREEVRELTQELGQTRAELEALESGAAAEESAPDDAAAEDGAATGDAGAAGVEGETDAGAEEDAAAQPDTSTDAEAEAGEQAATQEDTAGEDTAEEAVTTETYTVEAGDNLFSVAEQFYGDGQQWRRIAEANGLEPGAVLSPGDTLQIPTEE